MAVEGVIVKHTMPHCTQKHHVIAAEPQRGTLFSTVPVSARRV
jgi:hypothetical protein